MKSTTALVTLLGLGYTTATDPEINFKSECNDQSITYEIPVEPEQNNVLKFKAGICTEASTDVRLDNYNPTTKILTIEIPFQACQLKMYSDTAVYTRSSNKYFSSIVELTFGQTDAGLGLDVIYHTTSLAVQCEVETEYSVTFNYDIVDKVCQKGEKEVDGVCVWFGGMDASFEISEYTDSSYGTRSDNSNAQTTAGRTIYLGITASDVPTDFDWGVENCYIEQQETDTARSQSHILIDPSNTQNAAGGGTCSKNTIQLDAKYSSETGKPGFQMEHILFLLNGQDKDKSVFTLKCNIRLCCKGNDGDDCAATDKNGYCAASRGICT